MFVSKVTFSRAQKQFKGKPACLALLNYLHPFVLNFNFEKGKKLVVGMPHHHMLIGQASPLYVDSSVAFSHRTIRKVLRALGLCPDQIANKQKITITLPPSSSHNHNSIEFWKMAFFESF